MTENKHTDYEKTADGSRSTLNDLLPCPFCGTAPQRYVNNDILYINCPICVSVGFHNHVRLGCRADSEWNNRAC